MTKETRIGLLVGLLFIVAFGLVLAEFTGPGSLPPAPVAAEENVDIYAHTPVVEEVFPPVGRAGGGPSRPGPSAGRLAGNGGGPPIVSALSYPATAAERGGIIEAEIGPGPAVLAATKPVAPPGPVPPAPGPPTPVVTGPRRRIYKVQPNDSLIRIARKVYGPENEALYKRIYEANRGVLTDESTVSIGQELVIPRLEVGGPRPAETPQRAVAAGHRAVSPPAGRAPAGRGEYVEMSPSELRSRFAAGAARSWAKRRVYVVQRGDSLTEIARRFLRDDSPAAVRKLFNANRGTLQSPDMLQVGMKLNIPS